MNATTQRAEPITPPVIVVSGLPRSGTSAMMKMLAAGGVPLLTDAVRGADDDNPDGYFEFEPVKELRKGEHAWLRDAPGRAVKIVSGLLTGLPLDFSYQVIFMNRRISEVLASQRKMLIRRGEPADAIPDDRMAAIFAKHLREVHAWLAAQPNIAVLEVDYNALIADPRPHAAQVDRFLDGDLDIAAMCAAVNPDLYRNR